MLLHNLGLASNICKMFLNFFVMLCPPHLHSISNCVIWYDAGRDEKIILQMGDFLLQIFLLGMGTGTSVWRIFVFVFVFANISLNIHIHIRIRPFLSPRIYSYSYSPFFINPNIFVFVFVLDMDTEYISICIILHKFNQIP